MQPPNARADTAHAVRPNVYDVARLLGATVHERPDGTIDFVTETRIAAWTRWSDAALRRREEG